MHLYRMQQSQKKTLHDNLVISKLWVLDVSSLIRLYSYFYHSKNVFKHPSLLPIQFRTQSFQRGGILAYLIADSSIIQVLSKANVFAVLLLSLLVVYL